MSNATAPAPAPASEQTLWKGTPSPMLLTGYFFGIVLVLLIPLALTFFVPPAAVVAWPVAGLLVLVLGIAILVEWIKLRSTSYTITNQRVQIEKGLLAKSVEEIDLRYVEDSTFGQSLVERILGIGSVTLLSSDKTTPRYVLRSIRDPRSVREMIRAQAYQASQRQIFTRST